MQELLRILMQMVSNPVSAFTMLLILFISVIWVVHWLTKKFTRIDMTQQHFKQSLEVLTDSVREVKTEVVNLSVKMDNRFVKLENDMNVRFDKVDKRFVRLETEMNDRFDKVDKRFVRLETEMNDRFDKVDEHFVRLETDMNDRFAKVDEHFVRLETDMNDRFDKLEAKMDGRIDKLEVKTDEHFERVEMRIERVETTLAATREDVASLKAIAKMAMRTGVPVRHLSPEPVEMEMVE